MTTFRINKLSLAEALRAIRTEIRAKEAVLYNARRRMFTLINNSTQGGKQAAARKVVEQQEAYLEGLRCALSLATGGDE